MKTLKITMLALLMLVGNFIWAQQADQKTAEERAAMHAKKLTEKLILTGEQGKSVYTLALTRVKQHDADKVKFKDNKEGMNAAHKQSGDTFDAGLAKILTVDQMIKYNQMKAEQKDRNQATGAANAGE